MKALVLGLTASLAVGGAYAQTATPPPNTTMPNTAIPNTGMPNTGMPNTGMPTTGMPTTTMSTTGMSNSATGTAAASGNSNQAVATTTANAPMPAKGANSFTMGEAGSRIAKNGFTNVTGLTKDADGVWRGQAEKSGTSTAVWLDYKGNVGTN